MSELTERLAAIKARDEERRVTWEKKHKSRDGYPPRRTPWGDDSPDNAERFEVLEKAHGRMGAEDDELHQEFQDAADLFVIAHRIGMHDKAWQGNPNGFREWLTKSTDLGRKLKEISGEFVAKAMDEGTATEGGAWVPTTMSGRLHEVYRLPLKVAPLFEQIPMGSNNHDEPVDGPDIDARKGSETDSDDPFSTGAIMPVVTPTTYNSSFSAMDIQAVTYISSQLEQDSVIRTATKVRNKLQIAHARAQDVAILMGDVTTGVYPDADIAADPTVATRAERLWDGLRYLSNAAARINCNGNPLTTAKIREARAAMGVYGNRDDCVVIFGVVGEAQLLNLPELITVDKFGPQASIVTGQVGKVDGMPVVISQMVKEDVSANGFNVGALDDFIIGIIVNVKAFGYGVREKLNIITVQLPLSRQVAVASFQRGDFQELVYDITAVNPVAMLINLPQTP